MTVLETREATDLEIRKSLNERYEGIAWGLFVVLLGVLWLLPAAVVPEDTWLVGAGLILLALNSARFMSGIRVSVFTSILGGGAVIAGGAQMFGLRVPVFAILVVIAGAYLIIREIFRDRVVAARS